MAFPIPTTTGQSYIDATGGKAWTCLQVSPPVWGINKNSKLVVGAGMSVTGGMDVYGAVNIAGPLIVTGDARIDGDLIVSGNIGYSFISVGLGLTQPYVTYSGPTGTPGPGVEIVDYYAPVSMSGPIFIKGGTGTTNSTSYMLGHFVFDSLADSNFSPYGQTAAEFRGNVTFQVGNNPDSILFILPNSGGTPETNSLRFTNPFTTWGMDVEANGIRFDEAYQGYYNGIGTRDYFAPPSFLKFSTLPASGITQGAFGLGVSRVGTGYGVTGFGFLHLLHGGTGAGTTATAAIRVIRANNTQAYINYAGEFYGLGTKLTSDANKKSNITNFNESSYPVGKWLPTIRNYFNPYTFTYTDSPELGTRYGYLAQDIIKADPLVAGSSFLISEGNTGDSLTGTTNYFISQDQLLFGAVEAIRELDATVCRLWKTSVPPPPSRTKDNDLWFDPTTSKMYMRLNDGTQSQWIQTS